MLIRQLAEMVSGIPKGFDEIKKKNKKEQEMIYLCCKKLFPLITDFSSNKTEQFFPLDYQTFQFPA